MLNRQKKLSKALNKGRRELRKLLSELHRDVAQNIPKFASGVESLKTHGLLKPSEENLVKQILAELGKAGTKEATYLTKQIDLNRNFKNVIDTIDRRVEEVNDLLVKRIEKFYSLGFELSKGLKVASTKIINIVQKTEQEYRLEQVRDKISEDILNAVQG